MTAKKPVGDYASQEAMFANGPATSEVKPASARTKRSPDPEIQAMARIDRLLAELDSDSQQRIISWLASRVGSRVSAELQNRPSHADDFTCES
jgi:hypothetical protein